MNDTRRLALVIHVAFFLLLGSALVRYVQRHGDDRQAPVVLAMAGVLAALYVLSRVLRESPARLVWLGVVVAVWAVLVYLAPSFAWCAVPLFYTALRTLPLRAAYVLVALFTGLVIAAQLRLANRFDLDLVVGPAAVAALATAVFVFMDRQFTRQVALIDDLIHTRAELAATERRAGALAERQRLAMEIHDTIAQGLSSQRMLLQAADRLWDTDRDRAREHVRTTAAVAERGLAEARRFVHDLGPADLAETGDLGAALRALAARETTEDRTVECHVDGVPGPLPDRVQSALLRVAQGALANVREHSGATRAAVTLTWLGDEVRMDVADNGRGFDPAVVPAAADRGHGLPAIRARVGQLGGTLTVESAPGDGTVVSVAVPATVEVAAP